MAHYKLILAYDGTRFLGYQRQGERRTVQAELESALKNVGWQGRAVLSAGRTDTGVHATGQVAAFHLDWQHSMAELLRAINANLPEDVSAREISEAPEEFHPRFDAKARTYRYRIFVDEIRNPLREYLCLANLAWTGPRHPSGSRKGDHRAARFQSFRPGDG